MNQIFIEQTFIEETLDAIKEDRINLAEEAWTLKEYQLAENFYSILITQYPTDKIHYVNRARVHFFLKDFKKALADLKKYDENVEETNKVIEYYLFRALVNAARKKYKKAAIQIYNLTIMVEDFNARTSYREQFFDLLPKEHIPQVLDKLLLLAKTDESEKDRAIFKQEYIAYMTLAAENNDTKAQLTLSEMLWENDRFLAEMWLGRAAANHDPEAQYKLAEIFKERIDSHPQDTDYNFPKMKSLLKTAATSNYGPAKEVLATYYGTLSESFKTDSPSITTKKKRKALLEAVSNHESELSIEPPFKLQRKNESTLDAFLDARDPAKRVLIPDTTAQMMDQVDEAFQKDKNENKRNYLAANLTIIFANAAKKEERTARLSRTIPITTDIAVEHINIESFFNGEKSKEILKEHHKEILSKAQQGYKKISQNMPHEDRVLLDFIPSTADKSYNPNTHKHSEYAVYRYLMAGNNFSKLLDKFIQENGDAFKNGTKIYAVILDLYSNRASCTDCKKMTFSLQNHGKLLKKIQDVFEEKGYTCLTRRTTGLWNEGKLYFLVRIRAGNPLKNKNDPDADIDLIPPDKDLKKINNHFFFHKIERPATNDHITRHDYTLFESGTNATRPSKLQT